MGSAMGESFLPQDAKTVVGAPFLAHSGEGAQVVESKQGTRRERGSVTDYVSTILDMALVDAIVVLEHQHPDLFPDE